MGVLKRLLIGDPLATYQAIHERLTKTKALAVFSSDALSSVAYATEEVLLMLMVAGMAGLQYQLPIGFAILMLLIIVTISYRQTIFAYPSGGGSYIVSKENLGIYPGLVAGAALLIDYVLTVAVSISAGVFNITSAFPPLAAYRVELVLMFIFIITVANLRGIRESAAIFTAPTYVFIFSAAIMIIVGALKIAMGGEPAGIAPHGVPAAVHPVTMFLILRAFASGCTALSGVEAISNGVPAFREPQSRNAAATLTWMAVTLGCLFVGVTLLAHAYGALPTEQETVISQIARHVFGRGILYLIVQAATAAILILAANTSYADFPRLASLMARDGYLPRYLANRGERLVFSNGIIILALLAALLVILFGGDVHALIPLYAVGVFLSFTLSQSGMVIHWLRVRKRGWRRNIVINALGAVTTAVVLVVITLAKFMLGAWMVIVLMPLLVMAFRAIHRHYETLREQLRTTPQCPAPSQAEARHTIILPVSGINNALANTMDYARSLGGTIIPVHIARDPEEGDKVKRRWEQWNCGLELRIVESPYRELIRPLVAFIEEVDALDPNDIITILVPEFVAHRWWHVLLHQQTGLILRNALMIRKNWVVTGVPYHLKQ
jgi:amino acid transporter